MCNFEKSSNVSGGICGFMACKNVTKLILYNESLLYLQ